MQFASVNGYRCCRRYTFAHSRRSGDLGVNRWIFCPPRCVRLTRLHRIACQARKTCPPVIGNDGLHAFTTVRAARRIHRPCSIFNKTPHWNNGSVAALTIAFFKETTMQTAIDRVMQTYCLIQTLTDEEARAAREKLSNHLADRPQGDEHLLAVEGLRYLRSVRG